VLCICYMRKDKSNMLYVCYMRKGKIIQGRDEDYQFVTCSKKDDLWRI
jgi:hypothetical protein